MSWGHSPTLRIPLWESPIVCSQTQQAVKGLFNFAAVIINKGFIIWQLNHFIIFFSQHQGVIKTISQHRRVVIFVLIPCKTCFLPSSKLQKHFYKHTHIFFKVFVKEASALSACQCCVYCPISRCCVWVPAFMFAPNRCFPAVAPGSVVTPYLAFLNTQPCSLFLASSFVSLEISVILIRAFNLFVLLFIVHLHLCIVVRSFVISPASSASVITQCLDSKWRGLSQNLSGDSQHKTLWLDLIITYPLLL